MPRGHQGEGGVLALTVAGLGAAFGLASCCALPFLLAGFGLGTAWLGSIGLYAVFHRTAFIAVAALGLAGGAFLLWRQRRSIQLPVVRLVVILLTLGGVLFYYGYTMV